MNDYFILKYPTTEKFNIILKKEEDNKKIEKFIKENIELNEDIKKIKIEINETEFKNLKINLKHAQKIFYQNWDSRIFFNYQDSAILFLHDFDKSIEKSFLLKEVSTFFRSRNKNTIHDSNTEKKYREIFFTMPSNKGYKKSHKYSYPEKTLKLYETQIKVIYQLYRFLEIGGTFVFKMNYLSYSCQIELIYLLTLLFEFVICQDTQHFMCVGFLGEKNIKREDYLKIVKNNQIFSIEPKPQLDDFLHFHIDLLKKWYKIDMLLSHDKIHLYKEKLYENVMKTIYEVSSTSFYLQTISQNFEELLQVKKTPKYLSKLFYEKDMYKIKLLKNLVKNIDIKDILMIGLSYGSIAVSLLKTFSKSKLSIIDPNQESRWDNVGMEFMEDMKISSKKYQINESDITQYLINLHLEKKKYSCIFMNIDESFEKLSSYFVYIQQLCKKDTILVLNSFNLEYIQLFNFIQKNFHSFEYITNEKINYHFYVFKYLG